MMETQSTGWIIVVFNEDNSVEAVPEFWLKKKCCSWPKSILQVKKCIERRVIPNNTDFTFYNARQIGNKIFGSLAEAKAKLPIALHKSDLSSAEDYSYNEVNKNNFKRLSVSPNNSKKAKLNKLKSDISTVNSFPPRYMPKDANFTKVPREVNYMVTSDLSNDDSDNDDPTWKIKKKSAHDETETIQHTPKKTVSELNDIIYSPSGNWKVTQDTVDTAGYFSRPKTINKLQDKVDSPKYDSSINTNLSKSNTVKRQLHYEEITKEKSGGSIIENMTTATIQSSNENILTAIKDFQKVFFTSYAHLKHEVQSVLYLSQTINDNVEKLMKEKSFISPMEDQGNIMEILFPIKSEEDLETFDEKIKDVHFRKSLVGKVALLIGNKDLGNSVRRIMMRLFTDKFLVNYSLYGFKKKKPFSNLSCYHLVIDALRTNLKYKHSTLKEIDIPLGTWLSHAPFRVKAKKNPEENH